MPAIKVELTSKAARGLGRSAEMHGATAEILLRELIEEFATMPADVQDAILNGTGDAALRIVERRAGKVRTRRTVSRRVKGRAR